MSTTVIQDAITKREARIYELEEQLAATKRDLIHARQHEKAIRLDERIKTTGLIDKAMENGALCKEAPASGRNWLDAFWLHGYNMAQLRKNYQTAAEQRRRIADDFDRALEDLRPTFELILANREHFGAKTGERVAPIINEHFLKAYAAPTESADAEAPESLGGHELVHFHRAFKYRLANGTCVRVDTNDDASAYRIMLTTHEGKPTEHTTKLGIKRETLGVVLEIIAGIKGGLSVPGVGTITFEDCQAVIEGAETLTLRRA